MIPNIELSFASWDGIPAWQTKPDLQAFLLVTSAFLLLIKFTIDFLQNHVKESNHENKIRGPEAIPLFRPTLQMLFLRQKDQIEFGKAQVKKYQDAARVKFGTKTVVFLNSPEVVEPLLKSTSLGHLSKPPVLYGTTKPVLENSLILSGGQLWSHQRKILAKSQKFSAMKAYMESICANARQCVKSMEILFSDGEPHEVNHEISSSLLAVMLEMLTGYIGYGTEELNDFHDNLLKWRGYVAQTTNPFVFTFWNFLPVYWKHKAVSKEIMDFTKKVISEYKKKKQDSVDLPHSVLDDLFAESMDEAQILQEINIMIIAGHETSAMTLQFFCFMMALNPGVQGKCQEEIDQLFSQNPEVWKSGKVNLSSAKSELKYVEQCLNETLRLFPPLPVQGRLLEEPLDIPFRGETVRLPKDTNVLLSSYLLHRDLKHFPDPERFNPERFSPENALTVPRYAYIPFSAGPRSCVGLNFAVLQMKIMAAYMLRNFEMRTLDKMEDVSIFPQALLGIERNYRFIFKKRTIV